MTGSIDKSPGLDASVLLRLTRLAAENQPTSALAAWRLGECLCQMRDFEEAAHWITRAQRLGLSEPRSFRLLAECHLAIGRPDLVIEDWASERADAVKVLTAGLSFVLGMALMKLGRRDEAWTAFQRELRDHPDSHQAAEAVMKLAIEEGNGARLLAVCDGLPLGYHDTPVVRGYRAIALSLLGEDAQAETVFDYQNTVWRTDLEAPEGYPDISAFNAAVTREIRANPHLHVAPGEAFAKTVSLGISSEPATQALLSSLRGLIDTYIGRLEEMGRLDSLPPIPMQGRLAPQANIVTASQPHRAHLHKYAVVSGVYYVESPPSDPEDKDAGCLVLGDIGDIAGDHRPAWPTLKVPPSPGTVVLFPPHMFHAVLPTRSAQPRIAVAFDLEAAQ